MLIKANMEKLNRGDKLYLDKAKTKESYVNEYLACRDGVVEVYEYNDTSGYGSRTRLFLCENCKRDVTSIIRWVWLDLSKEWREEEMTFDTDSFAFMTALIKGEKDKLGGEYTLVRDY